MTIQGENTALAGLVGDIPINKWVTPEMNERWMVRGCEIAEFLLPKLLDNDTSLDTDTGIVEFVHPNLPEGSDLAQRELEDWVNAQMFWAGYHEIDWDAFPHVMKSLAEKIIGANNG
ncbi:hypothetical protein KDA08_03755 [Candidatus Saccharibacteria bacterium]|jgi:hypothetical protein|nr:hypothetical protein [Candidatus Saccharibacteria bacterium]MCA9313406.1 hypothetical protein [Candidatus Saccharibacteria bacterium]